MATNVVTMQQLLEAGAHFGHQTHRWNPRMKPYIFGDRNGVHIIDLSQTVPLFSRALDFVTQTVQRGGKVLFVGTKRQAQDAVAEVRSGFEQLLHRDDVGRHRSSPSGFASAEPCHQPFGWHRYVSSACGMAGQLAEGRPAFKGMARRKEAS